MLLSCIKENKQEILTAWFDETLAAYPDNSYKLFSQTENRFGNPVGYNINSGLALIFDYLTSDSVLEIDMLSGIHDIIKIKATDNLKPSEALSFIFDLKSIIRKTAGIKIDLKKCPDELADFERKIDLTALRIFDLFIRCREQIYQIRVDATRRQTTKLLERINKTNSEKKKD